MIRWTAVALATAVLASLILSSPIDEAALKSLHRDEEILRYRLPENVRPIHYTIDLEPLLPDPETPDNTEPAIFNGKVEITVGVAAETDTITLHYFDMQIETLTVKKVENDEEILVTHTYVEELHFCHIKPTTEGTIFEAGQQYVISITYVGKHRDDMFGFYRSSYTDENGATRWLATTHFQPGHARRAYPCFDEPAMKATFDFIIKPPDGYGAISNMPERLIANDKVHFQTTKRMSTYLTAFIVSDFGHVGTDDGVYKIWARREALDQAKYSLEVSPKIMKAMEDFLLGLSYSAQKPKMDEAAVPDFSAGAMENWGLAIYRERLLLFDEAHANSLTKQQIATVIAHEFAHMWFGDLVSPEWWNFLWLNEGFATYFESFATKEVETDWRLEEQFVVRDLQPALAFDAMSSTHSMTVPVGSLASIRGIFTTISYEKAGSVIRMMEHFLTTEVFRRGLKRYLEAHEYSVANEEDLFLALQTEYDAANPSIDLNVREVMVSWSQQPGFPLVTVKTDGDQLIITQERFLLESSESTEDALWSIPLTYTVQDGSFDDTSTKDWLESSSLTIPRPSALDKWHIFNVQEIGFYRVNYDEANWKLLTDYLSSTDYEKIHVLNRAQIVDDAMMFARTGILQYSTALELAKFLSQEKDYVVWFSALNAFSYLELRLRETDAEPLLREYLKSLFLHLYEEIGFEQRAEDSHVTKLHRSLILQWACNLDHEHCITRAREKFNEVHGPSSRSCFEKRRNAAAIPADLQSVVYCIAIRHGGVTEWERLWNIYVNSNYAPEQTLILNALGCTTDKDLINEYLMKSITPNSGIRRQDATSVFTSVYNHFLGLQMVFTFLNEHYDDVALAFGNGVSTILSAIGPRITTRWQLTLFRQFVASQDLGAATAAANRAIEIAEANLNWYDQYGPVITDWLEKQVPTTTPDPTTTTVTTITEEATTVTTITEEATTVTTTTEEATTVTTTTEEPETTTAGKENSTRVGPVMFITLLVNICYVFIKCKLLL